MPHGSAPRKVADNARGRYYDPKRGTLMLALRAHKIEGLWLYGEAFLPGVDY
jgi:hypothetical protein